MEIFLRIVGVIIGVLSLWGEYVCKTHYPAHGILWVGYGIWFLISFLLVTACSGIDWSDFFLFDALGDLFEAIFSSMD